MRASSYARVCRNGPRISWLPSSLEQTLFLLSAVAWLPAGLALMRLFGREMRVGRLAGAAVAIDGLAVLPIDAARLFLGLLVVGVAMLRHREGSSFSQAV